MVRRLRTAPGVAALVTTLVTILAATLGGCGGAPVGAVTAGDVPTAGAARSTAPRTPSADASREPSTKQAVTRPPTPLGHSVTYQNGVVATVSRARRLHLVGYMETRRGHMGYVRFTVTVRNGSPARIFLSRYVARIRSGGTTGHPVYDPTLGLVAPPKAPLPAAQTRRFDLAFGVDDTTRLVLDLDLRDGLEPNRWATS
jgi:hypothetical protein